MRDGRRIRVATEADLPLLADVERAAGLIFRQVGMPEIADDEPPPLVVLQQARRADAAWVAVDADDLPVAYLIAAVVDGALHVEQVSVHPDVARRGIGRRLLEHASAQAGARGLTGLTLTTFADVAWNAAYYERCGFRRLTEQELTPGLLRIRRQEAALGLDRWPRVCMRREVPAPAVDGRRLVPRTDAVLADPRLVAAAGRLGRSTVKAAVVAAQQRARTGEIAPGEVAAAAVAALPDTAGGLRPVLNATGVVLHTNLGRAALSPAAVAAVTAASGHTDVELDLATGRRARRGRDTLAALAAAVPAAAAVHVVNNGAAALVLAATVLAAGREIVVSRGELVEIGDGFRLPDLLESTGARLREVGTTNRTSAADYAAAVGPRTGFILKVHPSNFVVRGFTSTVDVAGLRGLGAPVVADIGSGLLAPDPLLPDEPDAATTLRRGADLVIASGDKLLGGPQCGLLLGDADLVERLRRHPLARALRVDKLTLAALRATLTGPPTPTWRSLRADPAALRRRTDRVRARLAADGIDVTLVESPAVVGGGGAPELTLASWALSLPAAYAAPLRLGATPVVGRVERDRLLLDLRCVPESADDALAAAVRAVAAPPPGGTDVHVLATAGHVDHGKSTLVRALTGMEPDRWAEERRRGMTIDLGYAWTRLPSGATVAFVDVPGHERFVPNMLAGVGPVAAALMVVAADEGWMPQSAEHLAALDALGVRHGLLVITRADLADPAAALRAARAEMAPTSLGGAETVTVSAVSGHGVDDLRGALDRLVARLPAPATDAPVRLWIDRSFTIRGAGTVVTGTLGAGRLRPGDALHLTGPHRPVRVRGLHSLDEKVDAAVAVARVAVNLRGVGADTVGRGDALITPDGFQLTDLLDVRVHGDPVADLPATVTLHIGSAAVPARVRPLGGDTARLRLGRALPLHVGDRALLRDPGRRHVAGGVTVLDVAPPGLNRRGAAAARAVLLSGMTGAPDVGDELRRRRLVRRDDLVRMGVPVDREPVAAGWLSDPGHWDTLRSRLTAEVDAYARSHPLEVGVPVEVLRHRLDLPDRELVAALVEPPLVTRSGRVGNAATRADGLPSDVVAAVRQALAEHADRPFAAPEAHRLTELGLGSRQLGAAVRAGVLLRLADTVVLRADAADRALAVLARLPQPFTLSEARQALDTSRRVAVPLLELLDRTGRTRRLPDDRRTVQEP